MPDALSKTVPIWICVLNRVLFPYDAEAGRLRTPEDVVSRSEHTQIEERVLAFVKDTRSLMLDLCALRQKLDGRPMVPVWVTPDMSLSSLSSEAGRNRVVLCTAASGQTMSASSLGSAYVQGAADDSESWALGLDAASFWTHTERLLSASEDELPNTIEKILSGGICEADHSCTKPSLIGPGSTIWIAKNSAVKRCVQTFDIVIYCSENIIDEMEPEFTKRCIQLSCGVGKVGSRQLRSQLPKIERLSDTLSSKSKVLVTCPTGKDLAVGVALALICSYCNDKGELNSCQTSKSLNKTMIKHRLSWIMISMPDAAPSRATLQSVNAFLLG